MITKIGIDSCGKRSPIFEKQWILYGLGFLVICDG